MGGLRGHERRPRASKGRRVPWNHVHGVVRRGQRITTMERLKRTITFEFTHGALLIYLGPCAATQEALVSTDQDRPSYQRKG